MSSFTQMIVPTLRNLRTHVVQVKHDPLGGILVEAPTLSSNDHELQSRRRNKHLLATPPPQRRETMKGTDEEMKRQRSSGKEGAQ